MPRTPSVRRSKQLGDEAGLLVEENVINIGIGDHPLQALNAGALNRPAPSRCGTDGSHGQSDPAFKFRVLLPPQVKDGRQLSTTARSRP
jgi:hypothetical protein